MTIENIILDFDGNLTDIGKEVEPFLIEWKRSFLEKTGIEQKEHDFALEKAKEEVLTDKNSGWLINGKIVAASTADPYLFNTVIYQKLAEKINLKEKIDVKEDEFFKTLFFESYGFKNTEFRKNAGSFLDEIKNNYSVVIVTNSKTDAVKKSLDELGNYNIEIIGDAKKYNVGDELAGVKRSIKLEGLSREVFLRRTDYKKVLDKLNSSYGFKPENTAVMGDNYELDLALPEYLGYLTVQLVTPSTPKYELEHHKKFGKTFSVKDYVQAIKSFEK